MKKPDLSKVFNIEKNESKPVILLLLHSFFVGIFISFFFSFVNGAFLSTQPQNLPLAYLVSGIIGIAISFYYPRIQGRVKYTVFLTGTLLFILLLTLGMWMSFSLIHNEKWLMVFYFFSFLWIGPFINLINLEFWGISLRLFDLRQGKRLFSLISSGDVVSGIFGFLLVPFLVTVIPHTHHLLLIAIAGLAGACLVLLFIFQKFGDKLVDVKPSTEAKKETAFGFMRLIKIRYFYLIFLITICAVITQYLVDYNFLTEINDEDNLKFLTRILDGDLEKDKLIAAFISIFFAILKSSELILKSFFAGRILNKLGVRYGIVLLPFALFTLTFIALMKWQPVISEILLSLFFLLALTKIFDRVVKRSIDEPAFKTLYQPLPGPMKDAVHIQGEGLGKQLGLFIVGTALLLFHFEVQTSLITILLVTLSWTVMGLMIYKDYRAQLRKTLGGEIIDIQIKMDFLGRNVLDNYVKQEEPPGKSGAYALLKQINPMQLASMDPNEEVGPAASKEYVKILSEKYVGKQEVKGGSHDRSSLVKNTESAFHFNALKKHVDGEKPFDELYILEILLSVEDRETRFEAIYICGKYRFLPCIPWLIKLLESPVYGQAASAALSKYDARLIDDLDLFFYKTRSKEARIKVLELLAIFGASTPLIQKIDYPDREIQLGVIKGLYYAGYRTTEVDKLTIKEKILESVENITWLCACLGDLKTLSGKYGELNKSLEHEIDEYFEILFLLLSFEYGYSDIDAIRTNLKSSSKTEGSVFAVELIENTLEDQFKEVTFPLFEHKAPSDRLRKLKHLFPQNKYNVGDRLIDIVYRDYAKVSLWSKANALWAMKGKYKDSFRELTIGCLHHPKQLMFETAAAIVLKHDEDFLRGHIPKLPPRNRKVVRQLMDPSRNHLPLAAKILLLKQVLPFKQIEAHLLTDLGALFNFSTYNRNDKLIIEEDSEKGGVLIITKGKLISTSDIHQISLDTNQLYILNINLKQRRFLVSSDEAQVLQAPTDIFLDLILNISRLTQEVVQNLNMKLADEV